MSGYVFLGGGDPMAMKFLAAQQNPDGSFYYEIWLDTGKLTDDNQPDPTYVRDYTWAANNPAQTALSDSSYQLMTVNEVKLLAQADLDVINTTLAAPTALSVAGTTF